MSDDRSFRCRLIDSCARRQSLSGTRTSGVANANGACPDSGPRDLTLLIIGAVIGSGIFTVPGTVFRQAGGSMSVAMLVWIVGGILSLLGALTYAELSASTPATGGLYIYVRDCFGRLPAFLYGWTLLLAVSSERTRRWRSPSAAISANSCRCPSGRRRRSPSG